MIVAWHEVPGTAPPQKSRPVGYGMIRAGVRTDSKIGGRKLATGDGVFSISISQARSTLSSSSNIIGRKPFKKNIQPF